MKTVGIIRDRGQLTIPESVRKLTRWAGVSSVVYITVEKPDEIVITPHQASKEVEWNKLFSLIKQARAIRGRGNIVSSSFISQFRNI